MYTLSTWYTAEQLTKRIAIFFFGMFGGTAISPLIGAALLKLEGKGGLFGWQWIFLSMIQVTQVHSKLIHLTHCS
jgi:MFS family permease